MLDGDDTLGPGMDLVISLFSMALILIMILTWLYFDSTSVFANDVDVETSDTADLKALITTKDSQLSKLIAKLDKLEEEKNKLLARYKFLEKQLKDKEQIEKDRQRLAAQLAKLEQQHLALSAVYEQVAQLKAGHANEKIPMRSTKGKKIFRVYVSGSPSRPKYHFKPIAGNRKIPSSYSQVLQLLEQVKKKHGSKLFVAVNVDDSFPYGFAKALTCDFWKFDYYEYSECDK